MLALTENAVSAVNMILVKARVPEGGVVRIAPVPEAAPAVSDSNGSGVELQLSVADGPLEGDQEVAEQPVFVDPMATPVLDDKVLDAEIIEDEVRFMVTPKPG